MEYLIDTNILIDILRKQEMAIEFLEKCSKSYRPFISYVSIVEIMAGLRKEYISNTKIFLNTFHKIGISEAVSFRAGELIFSYAREGKKLHFQDSLIAATCFEHSLTLATANIKDFHFIRGLQIEAYKV